MYGKCISIECSSSSVVCDIHSKLPVLCNSSMRLVSNFRLYSGVSYSLVRDNAQPCEIHKICVKHSSRTPYLRKLQLGNGMNKLFSTALAVLSKSTKSLYNLVTYCAYMHIVHVYMHTVHLYMHVVHVFVHTHSTCVYAYLNIL